MGTLARTSRILAAASLAAAVLASVGAGAAPADPGARAPGGPRFTAGAEGAGDSYFPRAGNGGYDVTHYDLAIDYTPPGDGPADADRADPWPLQGVATIDLVARPGPRPLQPRPARHDGVCVTINGKRATGIAPPRPGPRSKVRRTGTSRTTPTGWELTVQPRPKLKTGQSARVVVTYGGETARPTDIEGALYGWVTTRDGAMVVSEPEGSMTWYPVSDHPRDKATYSFEITVPEGKTAVANGLPAGGPVTANGRTTWSWDAPDQQASYLTTASVGDFVQRPVTSRRAGCRSSTSWTASSSANASTTTNASLALQPRMIDFFESRFGPYPFNAFGSIVDNDSVGYALETQTRPVYSGSAGRARSRTSSRTSGSATRSAPMTGSTSGSTRAGRPTRRGCGPRRTAASRPSRRSTPGTPPARTPAYWALPIGDPGPLGLFATQVYNRGAGNAPRAAAPRSATTRSSPRAREWLGRYDDRPATSADFRPSSRRSPGQDLYAVLPHLAVHPGEAHKW